MFFLQLLLSFFSIFPLWPEYENPEEDGFNQRKYMIREIIITGNKLTKDNVILKELPFQSADSISMNKIEKRLLTAKENLNNISLFNYVDVQESYSETDPDEIDIHIHVEERWYIWPLLSLYLENRNFSSWLKDRDLNRVTIEAGVKIDNLWGLNHDIIVSGKFGHQQGFCFTYRNIALDRHRKHYLGISFEASISHSLDGITAYNEPVHIKSDKVMEQELRARISYTYRPNVRSSHSLEFTHTHTRLNDTIFLINPNYWGGTRKERSAFELTYAYCVDFRDYHHYPTRGQYFRSGIDSYFSSDGAVRYGRVYGSYAYYWPFAKRWTLGTQINASASFKNTSSWILDHAIGYSANMRGYEYYVADGQAYVVANNTLKFNILPKTIIKLDKLGALSKFNKIHFALYASLHADAGYAYHNRPIFSNTLSNIFLYSCGAGLDLVTYYDIVIGASYSVNKQKKHGFYFNLVIPFV